MPIVTGIKKQKNGQRLNIYLDNKFAFGLSLEAFVSSGLSVGKDFTDEEIEKLTGEKEKDFLFNSTLRFLSYRPRSEKEIRMYLVRKLNIRQKDKNTQAGRDGIIEPVVEKLKQIGQIDDQQFAKWWIEQRLAFRGKGKRLIEQELLGKGIKRELMETVFAQNQVSQPEMDYVSAKSFIDKKKNGLLKLPSLERKKKITAYLYRRGYSWEVIREILESFSQES